MVKIAVHNGGFHADDVFAVATLLLVLSGEEVEVVRTRDQDIIAQADYVVDVGGVYDVSKKRFDHHQREGAGIRDNGIPYASFGLVWKEYGGKLTGSQEALEVIDNLLVAPIDAVDNGVNVSKPLFAGIRSYTIGDYLGSFMRESDSMEQLDEKFFKVVESAQEILSNEIYRVKKGVEDAKKVLAIYQAASDKRIIILDEMITWKKTLIPTEALYVIAPRTDGKWQVRAVPTEVGSFELKKPLPEKWAGLQGAELATISGVADAVFCHKDLFLAGAASREGAIALAKKALDA